MYVSLSDIAAKAGVSAATVSRILNDKVPGRVPETTQQRVRQIATEMNYTPNRLGRCLKSQRTMNIGVLVNGLCNPFFAELLDTLEEMIVTAGYDALPDTGRRVNNPDVRGLGGWPVDGILMWGLGHRKVDRSLQRQARGVPVVYMGHSRSDECDFVAHDAAQGTLLALDHLWERGHRKIAFASPPDLEFPSHNVRHETYDAFCLARRMEPIHFEIAPSTEIDEARQTGFRRSGFEAGGRIAEMPVQDRPTAVFCYNDLTALGIMSSVSRRGLRVPEDIAIVGFDGIAEGDYHIRSLTTVVIPSKQICAMSIDLLLRRIAGDLPEEPRQVILPTTLRIGSST
ncbi:MAG: LacI family DNA-binding transcriptional regulator [Capsulimonadaceae bacterium]|nr:LacI family DNA-binding transcriptional regulator [Capsulimonadaceae bacterium]